MKTCNDNIFVPFITIQCIQNMSQPANITLTTPPSEYISIHPFRYPLMMHITTPQPLREFNDKTTYFKQLEDVKNLRVNWLCIDVVLGTSLLSRSTDSTPPLCCNVQNVFTSAQTSEIFSNLFPFKNPIVVPLLSFNRRIDPIQDTHILDIHFIPHSNGSVFE